MDKGNTSLYVGDLHSLVTESVLFESFNEIAAIDSIRVCRDSVTRRSLGYAYVNFHSHADAERIMANMNYTTLAGRPIRLMWSHRDPSLRKSGRGNVFIKNLDKKIDETRLYDTFSAFGPILSLKIAKDEEGNSKGFGFIHYEVPAHGDSAITAVDGKMINNQIVYVGPFIPRSERKSTTAADKFNNCYVKNFSEELSVDGLKEMFAEFGEIKSACIMQDSNGKSRGFGFVCFALHESADAAVQALSGKEIDGRCLYVCAAQKKSERHEFLKHRHEKIMAERLNKYAGVNLYVKNLDDSIDDARLHEFFKVHGAITSAKVMTDLNGHSKGFGFVCFATAEEAKEATTKNGSLLGSKPIYVALAQRKEERRVKLVNQYQQRMQYRASMPAAHSLSNFFGQPTFPPTQRFFHAAPQLPSQPRWNRPGLAGPQMQLAHAGLGAATALRPAMANPYNAMAAMSQSQMVQGGLNASQFRGQPGARGIVAGGMPSGMGAPMPNAGMIAPGAGGPHQQFNQRANMAQQMMGGPRPSMAAVTAGARVAAASQMPRQMMQANVPGVRFNQTARNVAAQPQAARPNVSMRPAGVGDAPYPMVPAVPEPGDKQKLGEQLYFKIEKFHPKLAGKITGMLLAMENTQLHDMLESDEELQSRVNEALLVLKQHEGATAATDSNPEAAGQTGDSEKAECAKLERS